MKTRATCVRVPLVIVSALLTLFGTFGVLGAQAPNGSSARDRAVLANREGVKLHNSGDYEAALAKYEEAIRLQPSYVKGHSNRANALRALGRLEEARAALERARELDPKDGHVQKVSAWLARSEGVALHKAGDYEAALAKFEEAIRLQPNAVWAHAFKGNILRALGRLREARVALERARKLDPTDGYVQRVSAWLANTEGVKLHNAGDYEAALAKYEEAIRLQPSYVRGYSNRANALRALGRLEDARAALERARELDPNDDHVQKVSAWLANREGVALHDAGDYEASLAKNEEAIGFKPDYVSAHANMADNLRHLGRLEEARAALERARELDPNDDYVRKVGARLAESEREARDRVARRQEARRRAEETARQTARRSVSSTGARDCEKGALDAGETLGAIAGILGGKDTESAMRDARDCDKAGGGSSLDRLAGNVQETADELQRQNRQLEAENRARLRAYQREARRIERERAAAERRRERQRGQARGQQQGGMPTMGGGVGVGPTPEERDQGRRDERQQGQRAAGASRGSEAGAISRMRVRVSAEDRWTQWIPMPGRPKLLMRAKITSYNNTAKKYMWWVSFENRYPKEVCHTYGIGSVGGAKGTARHWLDPGEKAGVWFLVPVGPGETAEVVSQNFELENGCF